MKDALLKWFSDTFSVLLVMSSIVLGLMFTVACYYYVLPMSDKIIIGVFLVLVIISLILLKVLSMAIANKK